MSAKGQQTCGTMDNYLLDVSTKLTIERANSVDGCYKAVEEDFEKEGESDKKDKLTQYIHLLSGKKYTFETWKERSLERLKFGSTAYPKSHKVITYKELNDFVNGQISAKILNADNKKVLHNLCHMVTDPRDPPPSDTTQ